MTTRIRRLTAADLINLAVEAPDTPMHVGALAVLEGRTLCDAAGRLRLDEIRAELDRHLVGVPEFRQVVRRPGPLAGRPLWVDEPTFRIERHVHQAELPPPGDEEALLRLAEELMAPLLDRSRPLWRMWFVTGLPAGRIALVLALHHAIADGLGAIRLVTSLLDPPGAAGPRESQPWVAMPAPSWRELVRDNARTRFAAARRMVRIPKAPRFASALVASWQVMASSWRAPRTSLNAPIGPRRRLAVLRLDLTDAKRVAHEYGGKVNDLMLDLAAGGLRALLISRGEPVDGLSLRASVAVSLRDPGREAGAGNRSGVILVGLPLGESDPDHRLRVLSAASARAKRSQLATTGQDLLVWVARSGLLRRFTRGQHLTNVVESNVAGPPEPIRVLGAPVLDLVPIGALAGNLAISFLALSYAGGLTLAVRADADRYPDLPVLMSAMEREWRSLDASARVAQRQMVT